MRKAFRVLMACLVLLSAQWLPAAEAHAELVSAYPAPGASLDATPLEIRLTFSERIGPGSSVHLFGPQFRVVAGVQSGPDPAAPEQLRAIPPQLLPDTYTVEWNAVSVDGHQVSGSYAFAVKAPPAAPQYPPLSWLVAAVPLVLLLAGGAWALGRRRRGARLSSSPKDPSRPGGALS